MEEQKKKSFWDYILGPSVETKGVTGQILQEETEVDRNGKLVPKKKKVATQ